MISIQREALLPSLLLLLPSDDSVRAGGGSSPSSTATHGTPLPHPCPPCCGFHASLLTKALLPDAPDPPPARALLAPLAEPQLPRREHRLPVPGRNAPLKRECRRRRREGGDAPTLLAGGRWTVRDKVCAGWVGGHPRPSPHRGVRPGQLAEAVAEPGLTLWSFHMAPRALTSWLECLPSSRHW